MSIKKKKLSEAIKTAYISIPTVSQYNNGLQPNNLYSWSVANFGGKTLKIDYNTIYLFAPLIVTTYLAGRYNTDIISPSASQYRPSAKFGSGIDANVYLDEINGILYIQSIRDENTGISIMFLPGGNNVHTPETSIIDNKDFVSDGLVRIEGYIIV